MVEGRAGSGREETKREKLCSSPWWCGRDSLPACRQMEPIDLGGCVGQEQLQLGKEGEVVRGDVGMWAAADIVLNEPVGVQGAQDTQHVQVRLGVENIVDDTLRGEEEGQHCFRNGSRKVFTCKDTIQLTC